MSLRSNGQKFDHSQLAQHLSSFLSPFLVCPFPSQHSFPSEAFFHLSLLGKTGVPYDNIYNCISSVHEKMNSCNFQSVTFLTIMLILNSTRNVVFVRSYRQISLQVVQKVDGKLNRGHLKIKYASIHKANLFFFMHIFLHQSIFRCALLLQQNHAR